MGTEMIEIGVDTLRIEGEPTKLYEALAKAQSEFAPVPKLDLGQVGKDRKFKYAGYATLMKCVRPALTANGIALLQPLHFRGGMAVSTTILAGHGASIQTSFCFSAEYRRKDKYNEGVYTDDCQEFGRAHTYYRRYQLQSILGIEGDDDADSLPEVRAQFSEPARDAITGDAAPKQLPAADKKVASAPKANGAAVAPKPVAAVQPTLPSVEPSAAIPEHGADKLKELITSAMKQLGWKMIKLREFYEQHVDPEPFASADTMPLEKMRLLHARLVEKHNIAPF